jgi:hypothetical protein
MDLESRARWVDYSRAKDTMFAHTDTKAGAVVGGQRRRQARARLNCISHLLEQVPYEDLTSEGHGGPHPRLRVRAAALQLMATLKRCALGAPDGAK